jgi:hypothetical protein
MASQPLSAVSRLQHLDSSIDQSKRRTAGSRLTTSKRIVWFSVKVDLSNLIFA